MTSIRKTARIEAQRRNELIVRFAAMTEAELAKTLVEAMQESVELTKTWGRNGGDCFYATQAIRINTRIEMARAELASRRPAAA